MGKLAFAPFSIGAGLLAGAVGRKAFSLAWGRIDDQEPPKPEHRDVELGKLAAAVALEAVIFSLTRAAVDRGARQLFQRLTGAWPGDAEPESK